jgi:hypothetical protein
MTETEHTQDAAEGRAEIDRGTYEIVRERLVVQAEELRRRAEQLNAKRLELFGASQLEILTTERIRTENNCLPRDIAQVGGDLLFGYNVYLGLKRETRIEDVFSLHSMSRNGDQKVSFEPETAPFLEDPRFRQDFDELYRYYKDAKLIQLRLEAAKLLAVFQTGATAHDIKVLRWAVYPGGKVTYIDNRGERDHVFPASHDFEWVPTTRADHIPGRHPHVNVLDEVFVETVGGDLTVKVEDNTEDGLGIYREDVEDPDQSLADAEILYARVGSLILLNILPYRETERRFLIYNTLHRSVVRADAIGRSCIQLPEDHGVIFPGGYHLQSGQTKNFAENGADLEFLRRVSSPNGEDVLYVFHHRESGESILLPYNLIRKEVANPILCNGWSLFDDGTMVVFRRQGEEPTRVHPMQVWVTPFCSDEHAAKAPTTGSYLEGVGNADLVRGISDALSLCRAVDEQEASVAVYEDLIRAATRAVDTYHWFDNAEVGDLAAAVKDIRKTAEVVVGEFEKAEALEQQAAAAVAEAEEKLRATMREISPDRWDSVDLFVGALTDLRTHRGRLISLRDLRAVDLEAVDELEQQVVETSSELSEHTVTYLQRDEALDPYHGRIDALEAGLGEITTAAEAVPSEEALAAIDAELEVLHDVVGGLEIADATVRTAILEGMSEVLANLNRVRALLEVRKGELRSTEAVAEFGAQFKVLSQSVTSALAMADSPDACDAGMARMLLQLEELEGRFGDFDDFIERLATKREEIVEAFTGRKQVLLDTRQRRAESLREAAERILEGLTRRTAGLKSQDEINAFFVSDPMVAKARDIVEKLRELSDTIRADEVESRLKTARQEAARSQRDRADLFEEGEIIRFGKHRFTVNTQALDLTLVPRGDLMALHLTGTDFTEIIDDADFSATREFWQQTLVSETPEVARAEYLAADILADAEQEREGLSMTRLATARAEEGGLVAIVRERAAGRYDEGYERGVHDHDAARILEAVLGLMATADLLRFAPSARAIACIFWAYHMDQVDRDGWQRRARSLARLRTAFGSNSAMSDLAAELADAQRRFFAERGVDLPSELMASSGAYLAEELARDPVTFVTSAAAEALRDAFVTALEEEGAWRAFADDLAALQNDLREAFDLVTAWVNGFLARTSAHVILSEPGESKDPPLEAVHPAAATDPRKHEHAVVEAVALILTDRALSRTTNSAMTSTTVTELLSRHPRITERSLEIRLDAFLHRTTRFRLERVPAFRAYQAARHELLERERARLRLEEFKPRVMSSFVRNRLINEVYLPLIGDNLAKQIGAAGDAKRTDLMGLLLLISPPGYGKTTLMEYLASRLGLVFMKINGPALGHDVTSLDPAEAPSATARQEVEKINLALEMGNNVMLYLDDIQHTSSELLQKFISLCDAQRRIEGVWNGRTRTYDLRGKRFCVVMAGNPYTESGERFRVPDMLSNRADTYNLGDILEGKDETFALSYLENALTSNAILAPLSTRDPGDVHLLVRMAQGRGPAADQLKHPYSAAELEDILSVLKKMLRVQQVLLAVNQQYIASASQDENYRTEPRFQLQGSYRNMNRLAERIVPVMNDEELESLIEDHYVGEAQTLTTGAEQNLLKLAELRGRMTEEQQRRWNEIKAAFARVRAVGGDEDDPVTRVTGTLGLVSDRLSEIGRTIAEAAVKPATIPPASIPDLGPVLEKIAATMAGAQQPPQVHVEMPATSAPAPALDPEAVAQIAASLATLNQGLAGIGASIQGLKSEAPAATPPPPPAPTADLGPYLEQLNAAVAALADRPAPATTGGTSVQVVQALQPGVLDLLDEMAEGVEGDLLEVLRGIARRVKGTELAEDKGLRIQLNRAMKNLDTFKDLVRTLRSIDTSGLTPRGGDSKE